MLAQLPIRVRRVDDPRAARDGCFSRSSSQLDRLCKALCGGRDQLVLPSAAPENDIRALGSGSAGWLRLSVKVPKQITHSLRLAGTDAALDAFLGQATGLGGTRLVLRRFAYTL